LRSLLRHRGHDPDKALQILPMGGGSNMLAALEKGATDGFAWGAPQSQSAVAKNVGRIVVNPFSGEVPEVAGVPYLVIVTSRQTLEQKPTVIRAGVRAFARAMKLARDKPEVARALVRQHFADIDEAVFDRAWEDYRKGIPPSPVITAEQLEKTTAWLNITAKSKVTADYDAIIASDFARNAATDILGK
jgi:ABC-type nitrate/sulfonate/bicarbonate transport system substrate-binding protein